MDPQESDKNQPSTRQSHRHDFPDNPSTLSYLTFQPEIPVIIHEDDSDGFVPQIDDRSASPVIHAKPQIRMKIELSDSIVQSSSPDPEAGRSYPSIPLDSPPSSSRSPPQRPITPIESTEGKMSFEEELEQMRQRLEAEIAEEFEQVELDRIAQENKELHDMHNNRVGFIKADFESRRARRHAQLKIASVALENQVKDKTNTFLMFLKSLQATANDDTPPPDTPTPLFTLSSPSSLPQALEYRPISSLPLLRPFSPLKLRGTVERMKAQQEQTISQTNATPPRRLTLSKPSGSQPIIAPRNPNKTLRPRNQPQPNNSRPASSTKEPSKVPHFGSSELREDDFPATFHPSFSNQLKTLQQSAQMTLDRAICSSEAPFQQSLQAATAKRKNEISLFTKRIRQSYETERDHQISSFMQSLGDGSALPPFKSPFISSLLKPTFDTLQAKMNLRRTPLTAYALPPLHTHHTLYQLPFRHPNPSHLQLSLIPLIPHRTPLPKFPPRPKQSQKQSITRFLINRKVSVETPKTILDQSLFQNLDSSSPLRLMSLQLSSNSLSDLSSLLPDKSFYTNAKGVYNQLLFLDVSTNALTSLQLPTNTSFFTTSSPLQRISIVRALGNKISSLHSFLTVPPNPPSFPTLISLDLRSNKLDSLSTSSKSSHSFASSFPSLLSLDVYRNQLKNMRDVIEALPRCLLALDVGRNLFSGVLPLTLISTQLPLLDKLTLYTNKFESPKVQNSTTQSKQHTSVSLPSSRLPWIDSISIHHRPIDLIRTFLSASSQPQSPNDPFTFALWLLTELRLNENKLTSMPNLSLNFFLPSLVSLNLSENELTSIPPLHNLHSLSILSLSFNKIQPFNPLSSPPPTSQVSPDPSLLWYSSLLPLALVARTLTSLKLNDNPITEQFPQYGLVCLLLLPNLKSLDNEDITGSTLALRQSDSQRFIQPTILKNPGSLVFRTIAALSRTSGVRRLMNTAVMNGVPFDPIESEVVVPSFTRQGSCPPPSSGVYVEREGAEINQQPRPTNEGENETTVIPLRFKPSELSTRFPFWLNSLIHSQNVFEPLSHCGPVPLDTSPDVSIVRLSTLIHPQLSFSSPSNWQDHSFPEQIVFSTDTQLFRKSVQSTNTTNRFRHTLIKQAIDRSALLRLHSHSQTMTGNVSTDTRSLISESIRLKQQFNISEQNVKALQSIFEEKDEAKCEHRPLSFTFEKHTGSFVSTGETVDSLMTSHPFTFQTSSSQPTFTFSSKGFQKAKTTQLAANRVWTENEMKRRNTATFIQKWWKRAKRGIWQKELRDKEKLKREEEEKKKRDDEAKLNETLTRPPTAKVSFSTDLERILNEEIDLDAFDAFLSKPIEIAHGDEVAEDESSESEHVEETPIEEEEDEEELYDPAGQASSGIIPRQADDSTNRHLEELFTRTNQGYADLTHSKELSQLSARDNDQIEDFKQTDLNSTIASSTSTLPTTQSQVDPDDPLFFLMQQRRKRAQKLTDQNKVQLMQIQRDNEIRQRQAEVINRRPVRRTKEPEPQPKKPKAGLRPPSPRLSQVSSKSRIPLSTQQPPVPMNVLSYPTASPGRLNSPRVMLETPPQGDRNNRPASPRRPHSADRPLSSRPLSGGSSQDSRTHPHSTDDSRRDDRFSLPPFTSDSLGGDRHTVQHPNPSYVTHPPDRFLLSDSITSRNTLELQSISTPTPSSPQHFPQPIYTNRLEPSTTSAPIASKSQLRPTRQVTVDVPKPRSKKDKNKMKDLLKGIEIVQDDPPSKAKAKKR
ncbi:hypothetical protein BLNAU_13341 [Blattamonas nauphoetae]|uniref:Uncharacterized protein n=1 Tax=Blattamonas nauphoetae TaxID=2049346 RepID=A0ABQ9XLN0_9EUKA|nr:hypothetical protein BLNAU_13341 [Blattamonas nauphoetae]